MILTNRFKKTLKVKEDNQNEWNNKHRRKPNLLWRSATAVGIGLTIVGLPLLFNATFLKSTVAPIVTSSKNSNTELRPPPPFQMPTLLEDFGICETSSKGWEVLFESFIGMIFRENGFLPQEGGILDVGAQFGEQACHFALLAPKREVVAIDPSPSQVKQIKASLFHKKLSNLQVIEAGIGANRTSQIITSEDIRMAGGGGFTGLGVGDTFNIETVDSLFFEQNKKLAFAHIDVEGRELDTVQGATQTIKANYPVFTTEVRVHRDPAYTKDLLDFIDSLGYDSYVIDEVCGYPHMDFRNILNVPRKLSTRLINSDAFTFALNLDAVWRVDSKSIFETVLPCCVLGGACCQVQSTNDKECCGEGVVLNWMTKNPVQKPKATTSFRPSRRSVLNRWKALKVRASVK